MKKKKLAASLFLAGALAAQAAMPSLAAYTADNNPYGDQHTTFGVRESADTELKNQISFQVPLYVTVVAIKSDNGKMAVPTNYIIKNTGNGDTIIGVTKVTAEHLGSTWSVVDNTTTPTATSMKFNLGGLDVAQKLTKKTDGTGNYEYSNSPLAKKGDKNVLFDVTSDTGRDKVLAAAENSQFVKKNINKGNKVYPLAKNEENNLTLSAETLANEGRTAKDTVAVFKVVYTVSALDAKGDPINSATPYAGEDAAQAGYAGGVVSTK